MNKVLTFDAPAFEITKSYRDPNGQMFLEGIASTVSIDQTGERMSPEVIQKMATKLIGKPLRDEHQKGWYDKMGEIIQADVVDHMGQPALWIKARLYDWSTKAKDLFEMLKNEGVKMGLSVAGKINPGGLVKELVEGVGKVVPTYRDVEPTEVSVTDHPANLDTFAIAVAKSLHLDQYDPNEYAKIGVGAAGPVPESKLAAQDLEGGAICTHGVVKKDCNKCTTLTKDITAAHDTAPQHYKDVAPADFLDPENSKYPADEEHLMPALRYFNHDDQRTAGGYDEVKWKSMGEKLAAKLERVTGERYGYDSSKEKVVRGESTQKKEVNTQMDKGNLVSKNIPDSVKMLAKEWGKDIDKEVKKTVTTETTVEKKVEDKATDVAKASSFSAPSMSPVGSSSSSGSSSSDSSSSDSSSSDSSSSKGIGSSDLSSILSELKSTLEALESSLSTSSSSSSGSSSSDSSSSDKTSTDKALDSVAADDSTSSATSDEDEVARAIDSLVQAANTMRESLAKKNSKNKPKLADADKVAASDYSSSGNVSGKVESSAEKAMPNTKEGANGTQHPKPVSDKGLGGEKGAAADYSSSDNSGPKVEGKAEVGKALLEAITVMKDMQKSLAKRDEEFAKLVEKQAAPQERKGYAITVEKSFTGHNDVGAQAPNDELYEKMKTDPTVNFTEQLMYKEYGILPKGYKKAESAN